MNKKLRMIYLKYNLRRQNKIVSVIILSHPPSLERECFGCLLHL